MTEIGDDSVDLVVTSPPYPMIGMWDSVFSELSPEAGQALGEEEGDHAFELMHQELDKVWHESWRVLKRGGFCCINIGDAVRTIGGRFQLYPNHARIIRACKIIGFDTLPVILWRKQTNAPNKFMGSGMLPAGAYVTLEHEYILIFRKGAKRAFQSAGLRLARQKSAFFWEERNDWFSDVWFDLKGVRQQTSREGLRERSGAFPFELAYRLILMYSLQGDLVLDPFSGTGTTLCAAVTACRSSIAIEIEESFNDVAAANALHGVTEFNGRISRRFTDHREFVDRFTATKGAMRHVNKVYGFPVVTGQEREMEISYIESVASLDGRTITVSYSKELQVEARDEYPVGTGEAPEEMEGQLRLPFS